MNTVTLKLIRAFDPMYFILWSLSAPDRYLIKPVFVIPNRNISINDPAVTNNTHSPKMSNEKLRASIAKPIIPKMAMITFPARERKLSS